MIVNEASLKTLFTGFSAAFQMGVSSAPSRWKDVAMKTQSTTSEEMYGWLGAVPRMREWLGERVINNLSVSSYTIKNRKFENTIAVPRERIEDDRFGIYSPMIQQMGRDATMHPDELVFSLLASGFSKPCYDGQYFFDTDHPVGLDLNSVSNMQAGNGPAWYLLDCSQAIKPLIFQDRVPYEFQALDQSIYEHVFMRDEFVYGIRARANAGYGLWQLAFASKAPLTAENYEAARISMQSQVSDTGRVLGISPTHIVVPPALDGNMRRLIKAGIRDNSTNEWVDSADPIVTHYLNVAPL